MESVAKFLLYSLKFIPQNIIEKVKNQEPDPCYFCKEPILLQVFNKNLALTLLPCGHIHHYKCIKNNTRCPFPSCTEIIENTGTTFINTQAQVMERLKELNSNLVLGNETINIIANKYGVYPNQFPSNISRLRKLTGPEIDEFLEFYDLPKDGFVKDRRKRLANYIGIQNI
ncbi:hypothetical protein C1645_789137 [Glomus cerebriforme]|uniref:RING-type domain-containing protein n=1 Tax=Glomus cerebriforme TaxID=658196 RepID=A0A397SCL2_9GLOM|nr:hypothetical protein C1645_789137 [Glomus cerebriforme]